MNELKLSLTLEEVNSLLDALGSQPFKHVHQLIAKIQSQATSQLQNEKPDGSIDKSQKEAKTGNA